MAIPNATWIWNAYLVDEPDEDEKQRFVRSFHLPSNVTVLQAQVRMSADNGFKLKVNNKTIADYKDVETNYFHVFEFDVTSKLKNVKNTFRWDVENFEQPGGTAYSNPAGLIFEITVTYELPVTNGCCPE